MPITPSQADVFSSLLRGGTSLAGGIISGVQQRRLREELQNLDIPPAERFMYEAMLMQEPEKFVAMLQGRTGMEQITEDPRLRQAQIGALQGLQDIAAGGGYTTAERGDIERTTIDMLTRQRGAEEAAMQRAQAQGLGGSGLRLASDIGRRQAGIGAASQQGFDIAKGGQQRALQAMQAAGGMGGQIRGQEFGQQAQIKAAQDAINRANVAAQNVGQQFNIQQQQQTAAANQAAINAQRAAAAQAQKDRTMMEMQKVQAGG